jgi:hypothetical protein
MHSFCVSFVSALHEDMGDEDMKDMPAGKNMGAALGTAPAASSSFGR